MKRSKRRNSLGNLLDACGIHADFIEDLSAKSSSASLAVVESSSRWIELAISMRTESPKLRFIALTSHTAEWRPVDVRANLRNAVFLILPVTVIALIESGA